MTDRKPRITILTGAGASRPLGLPTMDTLLPAQFADKLVHGQRDVFDMAANWAMLQNKDVLDFEHLLTGVDMVARLASEDGLAMAFAPPRTAGVQPGAVGRFQFKQAGSAYVESNLEGYRKDALDLTEQLRRVVHDRLSQIDTGRAAALYQRLFTFLSAIVGPTGQIDFFTTNYDRAVETGHETPIASPTGFDFELVKGFTKGRQRHPFWDPGVYGRPAGSLFMVKLYKLHGSLDWRRQDSAVMEVGADEYVQNKNALIYPVRKPVIEEPFKTLLMLLQQRLQNSDLCIVIGNSMRDEHIRNCLIERLKSDTMHLAIVDPHADRLSALLRSEIGPERLGQLVESVQLPFGGSEEDQREFEVRIGALAARTTSTAVERDAVASMKSDLQALVAAQQKYFTRSNMYSSDVGAGGLNFTVTPGNTLAQLTLTGDGWNATIGNGNTRVKCSIFIGSTPVGPATQEGVPACE